MYISRLFCENAVVKRLSEDFIKFLYVKDVFGTASGLACDKGSKNFRKVTGRGQEL